MTIYLDLAVFFSFLKDLTSSLSLSANSFISDFTSLGKSIMDIKNNKGPSTNLWKIPECLKKTYAVGNLMWIELTPAE